MNKRLSICLVALIAISAVSSQQLETGLKGAQLQSVQYESKAPSWQSSKGFSSVYQAPLMTESRLVQPMMSLSRLSWNPLSRIQYSVPRMQITREYEPFYQPIMRPTRSILHSVRLESASKGGFQQVYQAPLQQVYQAPLQQVYQAPLQLESRPIQHIQLESRPIQHIQLESRPIQHVQLESSKGGFQTTYQQPIQQETRLVQEQGVKDIQVQGQQYATKDNFQSKGGFQVQSQQYATKDNFQSKAPFQAVETRSTLQATQI